MAVSGGIGGFLQGISGEADRDPSLNDKYLSYDAQKNETDRAKDIYGNADVTRDAPKIRNPEQADSQAGLAGSQDRQRGYQNAQTATQGDQRMTIQDQRQTIADQRGNIADERNLGSYNVNQMNGTGPSVATGQLQKGIDRSIVAQIAAARSGSNPGGEAAAMRGAQGQAATLQGQAASDAAVIRAQESQAAAQRQQSLLGQVGSQQAGIAGQQAAITGQQAGIAGQQASQAAQEADIAKQLQAQYGLEQGNALEQAKLMLASRQTDDQRTLGMYDAAAKQQQLADASLTNQQKVEMEGYKAKNQADQANVDTSTGFLGGVIGAAGGALSLFSDERLKSFTSDEDSKDFDPDSFAGPSLSGKPNRFQTGIASGVKFGSGLAKTAKGMSGGSGDSVGSDAWAKKVNSGNSPSYAGSSAPDASGGPDWLSSYMASKPQTGQTSNLSVTQDPYSDEDMKFFMDEGGASSGPAPAAFAAMAPGGGMDVGGTGKMMNAMDTRFEKNPGANPVSDAGKKSFMSDEETKSPVVRKAGRHAADDFLDAIHSYMYKYKDPSNEPRTEPTGGEYLGITAQDLERAPHVGRQIVINTPTGKRVNTAAAVSAALASVARLNERVKSLEGNGQYDAGEMKSKMTPKKRRSA